MHVLLSVVGLLLILFGGGCTLVFMGVGGDSEYFSLWLVLGLAPLVGGFFMFRSGLRRDREKRKAAAMPPATGDEP